MNSEEKIRVGLSPNYDILVSDKLTCLVEKHLAKKVDASCFVIVSDPNILKIGKAVGEILEKNKCKVFVLEIKGGEENKNLKNVESMIEKMLEVGADRKSVIVSVGGGIVGDTSGFVASVFMRGIRFVQVPTTLLAMVDASIGGKVGVNAPQCKNAIGSFFQPMEVLIGLDVLETLPQKEWKNGLAEVVKTAVLGDKDFFSFLEKNHDEIGCKRINIIREIILSCCKIKAGIVEKDVKEANLRQILNYGHTIGHAIEIATDYGKVSHGEAIVVGMEVEAIISNRMGFFPNADLTRQHNLLHKLGLETILPPDVSADRIVEALKHDKKNLGGKIIFSLPAEIGRMKEIGGNFGISVPRDVLNASVKEFLSDDRPAS
ncbi:MAG: 3-dehydroquinate synthase [Candidatus Altiarchaeota archaeon]